MHKIVRYTLGAVGLVVAAGATPALAATSCQLGMGSQNSGGIRHVVYLQFDNVHLRRDNPNVPSDLEQIPALLNFLQNNGTVSNNHHTPLISHTSVDIVSSMTGVYGDKFGFSVGNSFGFFDPTGAPHFQSSFAYWADTVNEGTAIDPIRVPQHVDQRGKTHPAPWVPYTRAGCDVGAFSIANIELENTTTDVDTVFGPTSPEHNENSTNPTLAHADFEGIAIHCALGSALCGGSQHAAADALPDEPNGYVGFQALYGNKYVAPAINSGNGFVLDLDGNHIQDGNGNDGFPQSFDPAPTQTLGYAAQMLEAGVPVVYLYIEDAHDNHVSTAQFSTCPTSPDGTFGPGEATYVCQLTYYQSAFSKFFTRLAADGINASNTLFVITADENDHFAGNIAAATPAGCNGVTVACTYPVGAKGEVDADLSPVFNTEFGNTTPFSVHSDDAPTFHINGNPAQTDPTTRTLEQQAALLNGFDPNIGGDALVSQALADQSEMAFLHMITSDPARSPNFVMFGNPDYFLSASGHTTPLCTPTTDSASCFVQSRGFAWNHGDMQHEIVQTWLGLVGPGVNVGTTGQFTDHTDIRPTIMALTGLTDDYTHDGRVLFEVLNSASLPASVQAHLPTLTQLAEVYEEINAPTGKLALRTLTGMSSRALAGNSATYNVLEAKIQNLTLRRNEIAQQIIGMLEGAAFGGEDIDELAAADLIAAAKALLVAPNSHDFNSDSASDIAWRDAAGNTSAWLLNGPQIKAAGAFGAVPTTFSIVGQRDFDGDGNADLLWRDNSGNTSMWLLNGLQVLSSVAVGNMPTTFSVVGTGDFNNDGMGDILWRDGSGNTLIWLMNGSQVVSSVNLGNIATTWSVAGVGDFNADGNADILWRDNSGNTAIWFMSGGQVLSTVSLGNVPTTWAVVGTGDFNGDGKSDILWRDSSGNTAMWLMNGGQVLSSNGIGNIPTTWAVAETGDFDGDGNSDILWRDSSGDTAVWFMGGAQILSSSAIATVPTTFTVQSANAD